MSVHGHYFITKSHSSFSELRAHILLPSIMWLSIDSISIGENKQTNTAKQKTHCFLTKGFFQGFIEDFLKDMWVHLSSPHVYNLVSP